MSDRRRHSERAAGAGWLIGLAAFIAIVSCGRSSFPGVGPSLGGDASIDDTSGSAFSLPIPTLSSEERRAFFVGNSFFNDNWVTAPASTEGRDGLGPLFNAPSCSGCHFRDGRGAPPDDDPAALGLLLRLSVPGATGTDPEQTYGDQLQDRAIIGVDPEGRITITHREIEVRLPDGSTEILALPQYTIEDLSGAALHPEVMLSPRLAPQLPGVGLLEAVPEDTIAAAADPDDADGDGISGRPNHVIDAISGERALGRFGWKANVATVQEQNAAAFRADIGITSRMFPDQPCASGQTACLAAPSGGEPELDDAKLERITFYTRTLAVPMRRDPDDPVVQAGEELFTEVGCAACHTPTLQTGESAIDALANQTIHPFTDLLLHDMGERLADGRPDGEATGTEWRTPPLWGLGLLATVNGEARYLHDGRARTLREAILWHGGEAAAARSEFLELADEDKAAVIAFLEDL